MKKLYKVVGIMSGTSLDGLDFVLVEFFKETKWCFKLISSSTYPYPKKIYSKLKNSSSLHFNDIKSLDQFYTTYLSKQISKLLAQISNTDLGLGPIPNEAYLDIAQKIKSKTQTITNK